MTSTRIYRTGLAVLVGLLVGGQRAEADLLFFTDRASFEAVLLSATLIDFEDPDLPEEFGESHTIGQATFISTDGSGLFLSGPGLEFNYGSPSIILGAENTGGILIVLEGTHNALGMEIGEIFADNNPIVVVLSGPGGELDSRTLSVVDVTDFNGPNTTFFGWVSLSGPITSLRVESPEISSFEAIDNVFYGTGIPEPGSLFLMGLGLGTVGVVALGRRHRHPAV